MKQNLYQLLIIIIKYTLVTHYFILYQNIHVVLYDKIVLVGKPVEDGWALCGFSHDTLIPCHEWGGAVEFSSHYIQYGVNSHRLGGLQMFNKRLDKMIYQKTPKIILVNK